VATYQRHRGCADRLCGSCGCPWPCPPRIHAAEVIEAAEVVGAANEDPRRYNHRSSHARPEPVAARASDSQTSQRPVAQVLSATVTGYPLGGVNRRRVASCNWER
jgi:uncharacterized MAPEG superfamily protein